MIKINFSLYETDLPVVTSARVFSNHKNEYDEEGLYSQKLFGPLKNYECKCGRLYGVAHENEICTHCGVKCAKNDLRTTQFGQINLPKGVYVVLPQLKYIGHKLFGRTAFENILRFDPHIFDDDEYYYYDTSKNKLVLAEDANEKNILENFKIYTIMDLKKLYDHLYYKTTILEEMGFNKQVAKHLFINKIPVTPPDTRPVAKISSNKFTVNDITKFYVEILKNISNSFTDEVYASMDEDKKNIYFAASSRKFQQSVDGLISIILDKQLSDKLSIVRQSLLGKTLEFSGRAVIACGPHVAPYMVSMPTDAAKKLFLLETLNHILENDDMDFGDVLDIMQLITRNLYDANLTMDDEEFNEIFEIIRKDLRVIAERPPVLFYYNDSMVLLDETVEKKMGQLED